MISRIGCTMPSIRSDVLEVCVFRKGNRGPECLLLKRSARDPLYPGIWQVVTGTLEDGERAVDAAAREVREETGLNIERFWVVPHVNVFFTGQTDTVYLSTFFAVEARFGEEPVLSGEHDEYMWVTFDRAVAMIPWPGQRRGVQITKDEIISGAQSAELMQMKPESLGERSKE